jgi:hypothetical protein
VLDLRIVGGTRLEAVGSVLSGGTVGATIPEVETIPLGGKIRHPVSEIVSAFENLLMVQYHCGAMTEALVGRAVVVVGVTTMWGRYQCAIPPHINISSCCILVHHFIYATSIIPILTYK